MTLPPSATVSIVIPAFNEGDWVHRTLEAVGATASGAQVEILLIDDGSTDGSCENLPVDAYPVPPHILRTEGVGSARARNAGARHASGEILIFMDAHVIPDAGWLEALTRLLRDPTVGLAGLPVRDVERPSSVGYAYTFMDENLLAGWVSNGHQRPFEVPCIIGCCFGARREVFADLGGFDPGHIRWGVEDLELSMRSWFLGYRCMVDPSVQVAHFFKHDKPRNFSISWEKYDVNLLRCVLTYFDGARRRTILSAISKRKNFSRSLARVMKDADFWNWRADLRRRFRRDEAWYFSKFEQEFDAFEDRLQEIRTEKGESMTNMVHRRTCPQCGATNAGPQERCLLCQTPLTGVAPPAAATGEDAATVLVAELESAPPAWILTVLNGPQEGQEFPVEESTSLGRAPENDIVLSDDPLVSRRHAQLERHIEGIMVTDQNSGNGTFIDGERIEAPSLLSPSSKLGVGGTLLLLEEREG